MRKLCTIQTSPKCVLWNTSSMECLWVLLRESFCDQIHLENTELVTVYVDVSFSLAGHLTHSLQ